MVPDKVLDLSAQAMPDEYKIAGDSCEPCLKSTPKYRRIANELETLSF